MAPSSHLLSALPIELLVFVIDNLGRVEDVAALALTNRRLYSAANPYLYRRAAQCGDARALAWAANRGLVPTLRMALAAGVDPNHEFIECMPGDEWERVTAAARADAAAGRPKARWAMWDFNNRPRPDVKWSPEPDSAADGDRANTPASDSTIAPSPRAPSASDRDSIVSSEDYASQRSDATPATEPLATPTPDTLERRYHAVHLAARGGHNDILRMLVRHGAVVNMLSERFCACTRLCGLLNMLEHPEDDADRPPQWTPLHAAICHGHTETAKLLLDYKAITYMETIQDSINYDIDNPDPVGYGATALHHAAGAGLTDLVQHILNHKIQTDINIQSSNTLTPFYHAYAARRWDSTIPLLLTLGADMNCETKMYIPYTAITPLGEACRLGDFTEANLLIDLGADIQKGFLAYTKEGCLTPLHMCCMRSAQPAGEPQAKGDDDAARGAARMRTIEKLIAGGARLDARDCFGSTPLMAAVQSSNTFALEALSLHGAGPEEAAGSPGGASDIKGPAKPDATTVCGP